MDYFAPCIDDKDLLVDILLKFCQSDIVARVLGTWFVIWIEKKSILYTSPLASGYYHQFWSGKYVVDNIDFGKFPFQSAQEAKNNKTNNIHIEPGEQAKIRLNDYCVVLEMNKVNLLPAGLKGVEKAIEIINHTYNKENSVKFRLQAHIIWNVWLEFIKGKTEKEIIEAAGTEEFIDTEGSLIEINTTSEGVIFETWFGTKQHYAVIEGFIKETWGGEFEMTHSPT
ncbi:MAG: hypothetical protein ACFFE4_14060 [Candidatus Thorarchaeota archaeon]